MTIKHRLVRLRVKGPTRGVCGEVLADAARFCCYVKEPETHHQRGSAPTQRYVCAPLCAVEVQQTSPNMTSDTPACKRALTHNSMLQLSCHLEYTQGGKVCIPAAAAAGCSNPGSVRWSAAAHAAAVHCKLLTCAAATPVQLLDRQAQLRLAQTHFCLQERPAAAVVKSCRALVKRNSTFTKYQVPNTKIVPQAHPLRSQTRLMMSNLHLVGWAASASRLLG
ncbi:hypothetical protein COO60DRAFT_32626 [Scenedesmus sp. NREL 46B-D3]|nr:hypothetical protein COO60DRAFT_32626 [Scenedesmus sp. NREL 46B-D3]